MQVYFYPGAKDDPDYEGPPVTPQGPYVQGHPGQPCYTSYPSKATYGEGVVMTQPGASTTITPPPPKPPSYLALSIVTCICCSPIVGLIAVIFSGGFVSLTICITLVKI